MGTFIQVLQLVMALSILVILHELGHFIPAKLFKMRVEKFYLFFDPWFSVVKKKIGETVYGIGWLPLGGYVKIAGMVDESMDTEQLKKAPEAWEFRSKPAWQRLIVMLGGVTVNFLLAWLIYSVILFKNGENYVSNKALPNGLELNDLGLKMGFKNGDRILAVDGKQEDDFQKSLVSIMLGEEVTVLRDGEEKTFPLNHENIKDLIKKGGVFINQLEKISVKNFPENSKAQDAGLMVGDVLLSLNGEKITSLVSLKAMLETTKNQQVNLEVNRDSVVQMLSIPINENGEIGVGLQIENAFTKALIHKDLSLIESIPLGLKNTIGALSLQVKQFKLLFNPKTEAYTQVKGPIGMVSIFPTHFDWLRFWSFAAMFSVWLAFLNLLPIPGLDGGHVIFTLIEIITGKAPSQKTMEVAQTIGFVILMGLMVLVFGHDIWNIVSK